MVVFCKRCGTPVKLDNARLSDPAYVVKCQQCQRAVAFEAPRPGATKGVSVSGEELAGGAHAGEEHPPVPDRTHYLQKIRLFSGLPYEECRLIESRLRPCEFAPQQTIVKEGGPADAMYFITSGAVEVRKKDPHTGIDFLLSGLKSGSCFGEMALLTGKPRAATVVAVEPTSCSVLGQSAFDEVLLASPKLGLAMSRVLAERLEEADQQTGVEFTSLARLKFDPRVIKLLPPPMVQQHHVLPVAFANNRLTLAMVNPNNLMALDDVRRVIKGVMIEPVVTTEDDFKRFVTSTYPELLRRAEATLETGSASAVANLEATERIIASLQSEAQGPPEGEEGQSAAESVTDLSLSPADAPIVRIANSILALAIKNDASDIHLEPQEKDLAVRFRIDGELYEVQVLPKKVQMGLISRLKVLSKLDPAEKRLPQDGTFTLQVEDRSVVLGVSSIPCKWGEKVCLRVLDKSDVLPALDKLIFQPEALDLVRKMIRQRPGIIYATGPAGSGKSTLLHSALAELNEPGVNICTAEDAWEYDLPRANQVQTNREIGLDFARILRAILSQDSDVILVGETRDKETARLAIEAALTGRLVFTTLPASDAASAFACLAELGVDPFLMSRSTIGVIAQRLARRLCPACKETYTPDPAALKHLGFAPSKPSQFFRQRGCDKCSGTGYRGRVGVYEVLRINDALRHLVADGANTKAISALAIENGMKTLKDYAGWLLQNGWTTMDEILQLVPGKE